MHHHDNQPNTNLPMWKRALNATVSAIPIVGSFVNPMNQNKAQVVDDALCEASGLAGQVTFMYLSPITFTKYFPMLSSNMNTQMNIQMGTEMTMRMWAGDLIGKLSYKIISSPIKLVIDYHYPKTFDAKDFGIKLLQLLPLIGPFLGQQDWKKTLQKGVVGNIEQLSMAAGGAIFMMFSPYDMETDGVSVCVGTLLMAAGMTSTMLAELLAVEAWKKSAAYLSQFSLWPKKEVNVEEAKHLLAPENNLSYQPNA